MYPYRGTSMYGQMFIPIYERSVDSNNLTRQSAYIQRPQGNPVSMGLLHVILYLLKPSIY